MCWFTLMVFVLLRGYHSAKLPVVNNKKVYMGAEEATKLMVVQLQQQQV